MVPGPRSSDYEDRLKELDMLTLEAGRHYLDILQVYKMLRGHDNVACQRFKMAAEETTQDKTGNRSA